MALGGLPTYNHIVVGPGWTPMLFQLWRRLVQRGVMCDADRLIAAHGRGAYGMARLGATAAREIDGEGHWSSVAREVARRFESEGSAPKPRDGDPPLLKARGDDVD